MENSHCNGIDPFFMLMGSIDWGPVSHNDIVSNVVHTRGTYFASHI